MAAKRVLVTGGAGFIGSALVRHLVADLGVRVVNLDKLTYAGNLDSLRSIENHANYRFVQGDICDRDTLRQVFASERPQLVMHLAAESHVDRSIDGPLDFVQTNVMGTAVMLEAAREYWNGLAADEREGFRFHHISTDEVYGSLGPDGLFREDTPYSPNSPYAASKAASDHMVRAWHHTYGLPVVVTNCSNNYGPYQFPEKLIPHMILNALAGRPLPIYGAGDQVRDWLYVEDHARALWLAATRGRIGETYNIGGHNERTNMEVVRRLCEHLDRTIPERLGGRGSYAELITRVADRPGHDRRYAIDAGKIERELGWRPSLDFETGLARTIDWYLANDAWVRRIQDGGYRAERIGLSGDAA